MSCNDGGHGCSELTGTPRAERELEAKAAEWLLEIHEGGWLHPSCGLRVRETLSGH